MTDQEEKRLLAELKALPDYQGWTFVYVYPGYFSYLRGDTSVYFTPDWEGDATLPIQVQDNDGNVLDEYSKSLPLPHGGRTGRKLFHMVRPTLDAIAGERVSHSTKKKTIAQLDREIAEALTRERTQSPHSIHTPTWERDRLVRKLERQKSRLKASGRSAHAEKKLLPKGEVTAILKQLRAEAKRIGADVTFGRVGAGKYQEISLWGSDADAIASQLERRGFQRTLLSGIGDRLSPITMVR